MSARVFVGFLAALCRLQAGFAQDFGYDGQLGPEYWGDRFQQCVGKHQSPIDIQEQNVEYVRLPPLNFRNFEVPPYFLELTNNGHTVKVTANTSQVPTIFGGPFLGRYVLSQFHWHWGKNDKEGSETLINNNSYPMELHMVFYLPSYGNMESASEHPDGLVVLAFMYSKTERANENYKPLVEAIPLVQRKGAITRVFNPPPLDLFMPRNRSVYFTYSGSLTTPPCSEVVTWIEFKNTIPLSHEQIDIFRQLDGSTGKISHNFRPTQPLHGRVIRMNLPDDPVENREVEQSGSFLSEIFYKRSSSTTSSLVFSTIVASIFAYILV